MIEEDEDEDEDEEEDAVDGFVVEGVTITAVV